METQQSEEVSTESVDALSKDEMFHLLSNRRRRDTLRYLTGRDEPVDMRDLAEQVAAWEQETTVQQLSSQERQRVYIALYQTHLPKLDDYGVVTYDQSRGIIERTERADRLAPYLDESDEPTHAGRPRLSAVGTYELAVYVAGPTVLVVGWLGLLPAFVLLVATWTALIAVALAHRGGDRWSRAVD
ncbi:DUF7344 domain-containing protein [Halalkalicoccus ordinarius]|uniref:DUF7344 domain-containing protein n=1 Tax=Halalkalicoccus ordinarius TaxID=3116651 RepID=UPI00300E954B